MNELVFLSVVFQCISSVVAPSAQPSLHIRHNFFVPAPLLGCGALCVGGGGLHLSNRCFAPQLAC